MNAMVEFENARKEYGKKVAVVNLNLSIPQGELFVLVGPNGAGKTTTLKMLVGLLRPTQGSVRVGGHDMKTDPLKAKALMSFVPDVPYVYDKLTPRELLRFVGKLYDLDSVVINARTEELLSFFSLDHVRDTLIEEFSHGMKQKAILSAALLHNPKVLVLDEPMVGLDPMSIKSFKDFLQRKSKEGTTIIFSTHTLSMAEELAQRVGIINKGELIALGSMQELRQKYQSRENLENMFMALVEKEEAAGRS
ncbi:MAG TPA: ABC transporter ATP-binding protein [Verrucomicrobiae bacterium]|jgi:ABC-2 type transport system ATP-binding protein|nr:ABC transporter ATP-binding protein [Verrucomicrobiae bacterium]